MFDRRRFLLGSTGALAAAVAAGCSDDAPKGKAASTITAPGAAAATAGEALHPVGSTGLMDERIFQQRVDEYLTRLDNLLWPDLIIIGGGVSKKADRFFKYIDIRAEVVAAKLLNEAGIVGAALTATQLMSTST